MGPNKGIFIGDFPIGGVVQLQAAVQQRSVRDKKTGGQFISLTLKDCSGMIDAKIWDDVERALPLCEPESIINVEGRTDLYNGALQLTISRFYETGDYDPADFIPASRFNREDMLSGLRQCIGTIEDADIRELLTLLVNDNVEALLQAPAAQRIHHAWVGGLLEHVLSMCRAAHLLCRHYTDVNRDLVIAGIILHDFAKTEELSVGLTLGYTDAGRLVGHVPMGIRNVRRYAPESMPEHVKLHLEHLVASHHGILEHGAAKVPATREAILLHYLDQIDSKITQARQLIDKMPADSEWTEYGPALGTPIWVPRPSTVEPSGAEVEEVQHA